MVGIKEYRGLVLLYCIDFKGVGILTTHLIHYPLSDRLYK